MYANTCWGLLGLAVTFGLAVLGLPAQYEWMSPWFLGAAVACGVGSIICFGWPLRHKDNRAKVVTLATHPVRAIKLIEPSHIIILGLAIAFGGVLWQMQRHAAPATPVARLISSPVIQSDPKITESQPPLTTTQPSPKADSYIVGGPYQPEELRVMILALGEMQETLKKQIIPTTVGLRAAVAMWPFELGHSGFDDYSKKITKLREELRVAHESLFKIVFLENARFTDELRTPIEDHQDVFGAFQRASIDFVDTLLKLDELKADRQATAAQSLVSKDASRVIGVWTPFVGWAQSASAQVENKQKEMRGLIKGDKSR